MNTSKKWNILFIEQNESMFDSGTQMFEQLFNKIDRVQDTEEALKLIENNQYHIVISDISVDFLDGIRLLKVIKNRKSEIAIFALVTEKDSDKIFGISEQGIHVFELAPEQLDLALEEIARFDLRNKQQ